MSLTEPPKSELASFGEEGSFGDEVADGAVGNPVEEVELVADFDLP
jgi:hypothetical protein